MLIELKSALLQEAYQKAKRPMHYVMLFSLALNILVLVLPIYSLQVIDRVISSRSVETLIMLSVIAISGFIFYGIFSALRSSICSQLSEWLDTKVAPQVLRNTITRSSLHTAHSQSQNMRDLLSVKTFLNSPAFHTLFDAPWVPIFLLIIFMLSWELGLVSLVGGIILLCFALLTEHVTKKPTQASNKESIQALRLSEAAQQNAEAVESMGMMDAIVKNWEIYNTKAAGLSSHASNRNSLVSSMSKTVRMLIQVVIIAISGYLALQYKISVGGMIASSILTGRALAPFEAAIASWHSFVNTRDALHRLDNSLADKVAERGVMTMPQPEGRLEAKQLYYRTLNSGTMILKNITFQVLPGQSLGIIGPSAAGKSTLAKMLVGIWPPMNGEIRMDGVDVYSWSRKDFGQYVGYLPQQIELFHGTIRDNIARMNDNATDEDVIKAAKIAGAHDMILGLPKGYETNVGPGIGSLSHGQRQRIALARAFFGQPKLLVLDEPNSNLDGEGEAALLSAIRRAKEMGITVVVVAHKPSLVTQLDLVLALKDGSVEAFGPKEKVLAHFVKQLPSKPSAPSNESEATYASSAAYDQRLNPPEGPVQASGTA